MNNQESQTNEMEELLSQETEMREQLQQTIGLNLQRFRAAQGLTREELVDQVGISVSFYANLESGKRMMSIPTLCRIADVLCVSADALLYENQPEAQRKNIELLLNSQTPKASDLSEKIVRLITNELKE